MYNFKTKYWANLALVVCLLFVNQPIRSQFVVSPANASKTSESAGFYYSLPRQVIKVDFVIEQTKRFKGPYSDFSSKILGVDNYISKDETKYSLVDVIISTVTEPDPQATFYVEFDEKASKDAKSLVFNLASDGIILGANDVDIQTQLESTTITKTLVNSYENKDFKYFAESNLYQKIDTIVRKITIDTTTIKRNILQSSWVDRSPEQKARAAAEYIHKIRESRFNLLTGYQEVSYGNSITYMDEKLREMEDDYLSLFLGKEIKTLIQQDVAYLPLKENTGEQPIAKYSESLGLVGLNSKAEPIIIEISPLGNTVAIAAENKNSGQSKITNNLYYRIPENVIIKIIFKGNVLANESLLISQLGSVSIAPMNKTRLIFDPNTGMVISVKRE